MNCEHQHTKIKTTLYQPFREGSTIWLVSETCLDCGIKLQTKERINSNADQKEN